MVQLNLRIVDGPWFQFLAYTYPSVIGDLQSVLAATVRGDAGRCNRVRWVGLTLPSCSWAVHPAFCLLEKLSTNDFLHYAIVDS